jgi:hypothetical protein
LLRDVFTESGKLIKPPRLKIEKGGQGFRKSLPPLLSVNIDGKETDITSLLLPVHTPFQALRDLTPAEMGSNLSFPPGD